MTENEFLLQDRLNVIRDTVNKYGEENFYLSFSGGKDSTVVHHLLDMALPENKIPRVFCNTGIEYNFIYDFVKELASADERFEMIQPRKNIKETLEEVGYPFKSKEHSLFVDAFQRGHKDAGYIKRYLSKKNFGCPKVLRYQFTDDFKLKVSHYCCNELKKKPFKEWQKKNKRPIAITGMMKDEGGQRTRLNCIQVTKGEVSRFHPLSKMIKEWEDWFINEYNIKLCKLYYEPYNFKRTGCKGCPYSLQLAEQLSAMSENGLINERRQCEYIFKPVYEEYRRIGYRLPNEEQMTLL